MKNYSVTQAGNIAVVLGTLLKLINVEVGTEELTNVVVAVLVLGGVASSFYGRFRHGDITWYGAKK